MSADSTGPGNRPWEGFHTASSVCGR